MAFEQGWLKRRNAARMKQERNVSRSNVRVALQELYAAQRAGFATVAAHQAFKDAELAKLDLAVSLDTTPAVNQVVDGQLSVTDSTPTNDLNDIIPEIERIGKINGLSDDEIKMTIDMQKSQKTVRGRLKKGS